MQISIKHIKKPKNEKDEKGEQIYETLLEHTKKNRKNIFDKFLAIEKM